MDRKSIEKQFLKYVVPSMFTMLLTGFYTIVDGFFIGRAIGDAGLAAINIAWPITGRDAGRRHRHRHRRFRAHVHPSRGR